MHTLTTVNFNCPNIAIKLFPGLDTGPEEEPSQLSSKPPSPFLNGPAPSIKAKPTKSGGDNASAVHSTGSASAEEEEEEKEEEQEEEEEGSGEGPAFEGVGVEEELSVWKRGAISDRKPRDKPLPPSKRKDMPPPKPLGRPPSNKAGTGAKAGAKQKGGGAGAQQQQQQQNGGTKGTEPGSSSSSSGSENSGNEDEKGGQATDAPTVQAPAHDKKIARAAATLPPSKRPAASQAANGQAPHLIPAGRGGSKGAGMLWSCTYTCMHTPACKHTHTHTHRRISHKHSYEIHTDV